ncbi:JAB domain-containing protein [Paenibacillus sp. NPDC055715]
MSYAHNHPSGNPSQNEEDIRITRRLEQTGDSIGIDFFRTHNNKAVPVTPVSKVSSFIEYSVSVLSFIYFISWRRYIPLTKFPFISSLNAKKRLLC